MKLIFYKGSDKRRNKNHTWKRKETNLRVDIADEKARVEDVAIDISIDSGCFTKKKKAQKRMEEVNREGASRQQSF